MKTLHVSMDESGTLTFLVDADTQALLNESSVIQRASNVEPVSRPLRAVFHTLRHLFGEKGRMASFTRLWPCLWQINLGPIGGPVLDATYRNRQAAIDAEVVWLNTNFI
jgi:hypothetical protein